MTRSFTIRPFTCHHCGHKMRFLKDHCGNCYGEKAVYQRPSTVLAIFAFCALLGMMIVFA